MDLSNILVISGKPDLSELVSQTKGGAIVMNLVTKQKYPVFKNDRISSLAEIRIFTNDSECPLTTVFENIYKDLDGKPTPFDPKKEDTKVLFDTLAKVLPDYDAERVHGSDVKKLFSWYNILLAAEKLTLDEAETPAAESDTAAESKTPVKKAATKTAAPKAAPAAKATTKAKAAPKRTTTAKKAI